MDIKFTLLVIGLFIFTLGYVNQNKYNCNIDPSLNKMQETDLKNLFYNNSAFLDYERNIKDENGNMETIKNKGLRRESIIIPSSAGRE